MLVEDEGEKPPGERAEEGEKDEVAMSAEPGIADVCMCEPARRSCSQCIVALEEGSRESGEGSAFSKAPLAEVHSQEAYTDGRCRPSRT